MSDQSQPTIIVPARLASVRFPKKLLAEINGKALILHTADRLQKEVPEFELFFAVDGEELALLLEEQGYVTVLTWHPGHHMLEIIAAQIKEMEDA